MMPPPAPEVYLDVGIAAQRLRLLAGADCLAEYPVSTAANGPGQRRGSRCTPLGWHAVRARIGAGLPPRTVFVGRRPTGEIYSQALAQAHPGRDWILTRILWLGGLQPGFNRYGDVDSAWRYIYIHGTPDAHLLGRPASHGCIRMADADLLALFDRVAAGCRVYIHE